MEHLGTMSLFVHAAETGSFVAAGRQAGLSASAVGKAVARLEQRLGVRLFHRNTRNMTLTEEGRLFLDRCHRIFEEIEAAEMELTQTVAAPNGRLRVSLPMVGMLLMPVIADFMSAYPAVTLDLDFTDRLVDVIEEGFDVVIRTGVANDSRLMRKSLGRFRSKLVASPAYLDRRGIPASPADLAWHDCLRQRSQSTRKILDWPLKTSGGVIAIPETMSANTIEPLVHLAEKGFGIAAMPPFAVAAQIEAGSLVSFLDDHILTTGELAALWPTSRQLSPRIRAFVTFLTGHLQIGDGPG
ncbi:LysR family transcriptional regulator [Rhizobium sp. P32RR-XVIII]|uniref:LysR family transcriptional regulator n=1 Tax=Rhizobium sp. P32RR-XVIII TaxID=2726738 RepID=UPI00145790ED|nr:LysR family transcriptional regulator [Rhizobium sp. P32RR-XVIII]NLS02789.1 LysR family transcriptional regulator [Rhizobium sp. P32RR-XVIII]